MIWLELVGMGIGLMSGILALVREAYTLYSPEQPIPIARKRFWACVRVAFILSAVFLWYNEHEKAVTLLDDIPNFSAVIKEATVVTSWADNELYKTGDSTRDVFLVITISNSGASSVAQDYSLSIMKGAAIIEGIPISITETLVMHDKNGKTLHSFEPADSIYKLTNTPLAKGDARTGIIMARFKALDYDAASKVGPPTFVLGLHDYANRAYVLKCKPDSESKPAFH